MRVVEGVDRINNLLDNYVSVISSKKEWLLKQALNVLLVFVVLLVFGCLDFAQLEFHPEYLLKWNYWSAVILKAVVSILAFNLGINFLLDTEIKKDGILQDNIRRYDQLNNCKAEDFPFYTIKVFNVDNKKRAYINHINHQIYRLNRFSRRRDRLLYNSTLPEHIEAKKKNRYCIKRGELEALKEPEYIERNIESLDVKYVEVDPALFELEIDGSTKTQNNQVVGSIAKGRAKASINIVMVSVAISCFLAAVALGVDKQEFANAAVRFWHYCLKVVADIGVVAWQLFNGTMKTRKIVSTQLTTPFVNRNKVLIGYYGWRQVNGKEVPQCYLNIFKEKDETPTIELTEEELKKLINK